jgi:hypothetical protein
MPAKQNRTLDEIGDTIDMQNVSTAKKQGGPGVLSGAVRRSPRKLTKASAAAIVANTNSVLMQNSLKLSTSVGIKGPGSSAEEASSANDVGWVHHHWVVDEGEAKRRQGKICGRSIKLDQLCSAHTVS